MPLWGHSVDMIPICYGVAVGLGVSVVPGTVRLMFAVAPAGFSVAAGVTAVPRIEGRTYITKSTISTSATRSPTTIPTPESPVATTGLVSDGLLMIVAI